MTMRWTLLPLLLAGVTLSSAIAASSGFTVDFSNTIPNTVANLLHADGQGLDWQAEVLRVDLTTGSVHNDTANDSEVPQSHLWHLPGFEQLRWDSYVFSSDLNLSNTFFLGAGPAADIGNWGVADTLPPDLDGDGLFTIMDVQVVLDDYGSSVPPANPVADLNGDSLIGAADLVGVLIFVGVSAEGLRTNGQVSQLVSATWGNAATTDTGFINTANITLTNDAQGSWSRITAFNGGLKLQTTGPVVNGVMVPEPSSLWCVWVVLAAFAGRRRK